MARETHKRRVMIVAGVAVVLLVSALTIALMGGMFKSDKVDPYKQPDTATSEDKKTDDSKKNDNESTVPSTTPKESDEQTEIDPATVGTIDVPPLSITVSYIKGVGGFEYEVLRTPSGTQYVEFRSAQLIGTKCTDDLGAFASILVDPHSEESATLAKTTTVEGSTYGLSLAGANCTADTDSLKEYQDSFSTAFGLLKKS